MDIEAFRKEISEMYLFCRNGSAYGSSIRRAIRFGLINETNKPIVFYFETFNLTNGVTHKYKKDERITELFCDLFEKEKKEENCIAEVAASSAYLSERIARSFIEWAVKNRWEYFTTHQMWQKKQKNASKMYTTAELYELFITSPEFNLTIPNS